MEVSALPTIATELWDDHLSTILLRLGGNPIGIHAAISWEYAALTDLGLKVISECDNAALRA
ncbi:hypothetical protein TW79_02795 [Tritonibacter mobilis]|uniref:Uncharacterized protein n=1 Tax=Tritonibacter mobilis F1926 TaxID=1265309 RepID=A0A1B1A5L4_9RHOB|nr:hypothetical protein K529_013940 [Tritonibacter mobilis F1926]KJZ26070.1 hypothetical protein TW79_02795 [Tritonibacter mobilis]